MSPHPRSPDALLPANQHPTGGKGTTARPSAATAAPHEVRIIGGVWRRSKLPVLNLAGLRPTPNRVRETLFNWLGQDLSGFRCIDVFAGSGALGFEAASRGAVEVLLVECDAALVQSLRQTAARLKTNAVTVEHGDALVALRRRAGRGVDLVFLDPPFLQGQNDALVRDALSSSRGCLKTGGMVYLESPRAWEPAELAELGWVVHRQGRAGLVNFSLLSALSPAV